MLESLVNARNLSFAGPATVKNKFKIMMSTRNIEEKRKELTEVARQAHCIEQDQWHPRGDPWRSSHRKGW
jgi:hypothetical protein